MLSLGQQVIKFTYEFISDFTVVAVYLDVFIVIGREAGPVVRSINNYSVVNNSEFIMVQVRIFYETYLNACFNKFVEIKTITSIVYQVVICYQLDLYAFAC